MVKEGLSCKSTIIEIKILQNAEWNGKKELFELTEEKRRKTKAKALERSRWKQEVKKGAKSRYKQNIVCNTQMHFNVIIDREEEQHWWQIKQNSKLIRYFLPELMLSWEGITIQSFWEKACLSLSKNGRGRG